MRRKLITTVPVVALAVVVSATVALGSSEQTQSPHAATKTVQVSTRSIANLGRVLVNSRGLTLYMFVPDQRRHVTCISTCARVWPPLGLAAGAKLVAAGGVKQGLLGSDPNPAGGRVVTYNRWPLYTYLPDTKPGQAKGQRVNNSGGKWYVLSPSGAVITKKN